MYLIPIFNVDKTHIGVKRLHSNYSRKALDITIKQTVNRHDFSKNYEAYMRLCLTHHSRATYVQETLDMVEMEQNESTENKDCRKF